MASTVADEAAPGPLFQAAHRPRPQALLPPLEGLRCSRSCHLLPVERRAASHGLALRQDLCHGQLGGRDLQGHGHYTRDGLGDTGTWSFALTVVATKLLQAPPASATTTTGKAFSAQLEVYGAHGAVAYSQSTGSLVLKVSSSGKVSATGTLLAGTYRATGSARDTLGDTGTWSFALTIMATRLAQAPPDERESQTGKVFSGQLEVSGAHGAVSYSQSSGTYQSPRLTVGQGFGGGDLGGRDLQGDGHRQRQPR